MATTSAVSSAASAAANVTTTKNDVLGRDSFLLLLVTQMQNQDPMNPMDDKEFVSQLAQFSSLEQMMNMNESLDSVGQSATFSQAMSLSGKWVDYQEIDGSTVTGRVDSVSWVDGTPTLMIGGYAVDMSAVTSIYPGVESLGQTKTSAQAVSLIGQEVSYLDWSTGRVVTGKVSGVTLDNGWPSLIVGDTAISVSDVLETQGSASSSNDSDLAALAKSMVGMKVDYTSDDQTLSGQVLNAALDGDSWKLTIGGSLVSLDDVVKVYPAK